MTVLYYMRIPYRFRKWAGILWSKSLIFVLRWLMGLSFKIEGRENIANGGVIYVSKHQSAWETVALSAFLPNVCYVLKQELLKIPFYGWALKGMDSIPIDRSKGLSALKKVIETGKERLSRNLSVVIFPEGTRVEINTHPKFQKSALLLAKKNLTPIIPIAHNAGHFWSHRRIKPGMITIVIGKQISSEKIKSQSLDALSAEVYGWVKNQMERIEIKTQFNET